MIEADERAADYAQWLVEAVWYTSHPPTDANGLQQCRWLERELARYCDDNGLGEVWELYELREMLKTK
jgi:hypothetical protein